MIYKIKKWKNMTLTIQEAENEKPFFDREISFFSLYNNFLIIPGPMERKILLHPRRDILRVNGKKKNINF